MADLRGQTLGGFRILDALQTGEGSQGAVYRGVCEEARFPGLQQGSNVALKVMPAPDDSPDHWGRLERRTDELVRLDHANVVKYYGCFTVNDVFHDLYVVVEEFLEGESLKDRLARSPTGLDADEALRIVREALAGLDYLASRGIVHRDVKPGNIFLCADGSVKLIDFEIARQESLGTTTTASCNLKGTFDYMAPEFTASDFRGDVQSDIFSMGVVFHEMLTGKMPYPRLEGSKKQATFAFMARWERQEVGSPPPLRIASRVRRLLPGADKVLKHALSPDRAGRYRSFAEFQAGLRHVQFVEIANGERVYRLLNFIGKGGFGEVFKARLLSTGENVAVKHLLKAEYAQRFHREARIMAKFRDPCFVQLMDFFVLGDAGAQEAFLVMAFLEGMPGNSLRDAIRAARGAPLAWPEVFSAFARYAHGLAMMHRQGIFHRDIKPSNLYYPAGNPGCAAIMDLGIARDEHGSVTYGQVPGTLDYMPPEVVVSNCRGDSRMDIFALGLCLYEALTGKLAYPRLSTGQAGYAQFFARARSRQPPDFSDPALAGRPDVLSLLREMTDADENRRLNDAEVVASRILACKDVSAGAVRTPPPPLPLQRPAVRRQSVRPPPRSTTRPAVQHPSLPVARTPPRPQPQRHQPQAARDLAREMRWVVNVAVCLAVVALLAVGGYVVFPAIKLAVAKSRLNAVCDVYRQQGVLDGATAETAWLRRWSPQTGGWLALAFPDFIVCTNRLGTVRAEAEERAEQERVAREQAAERADCLRRLSDCRRIDGRLDEEKFRQLDGWTLPKRLNADAQIILTLPTLGKCLASAVRAKLDIEPVENRRKRIDDARSLMRNSWATRLLPPAEFAAVQHEVAAAANCLAGVVGNGCGDTIRVGEEEIPPGVAKTIVSRDGKLDSLVVARTGYQPIRLPATFDGRSFTLTDSLFTASPVRMTVPKTHAGVACRVGDLSATSGEFFSLAPGDYVCVYSRAGYVPQRRSFTVRVNAPMELPGPSEWQPSVKSDVTINTGRASGGRNLVPVFIGDDEKNLDIQSKLKLATCRRCAAKLVEEPVETRQDRLDEAARILTRAVAVDRVMTQDEAASLYAAIERRRQWAVGKVQNGCSGKLVVGGREIPPRATQILVFEEGLPEKWTAQLEGYLPKELMRDFDGRTLHFTDADFTPKAALGAPPAVKR